MPDCLALTLHNQEWPIMKSDSVGYPFVGRHPLRSSTVKLQKA